MDNYKISIVRFNSNDAWIHNNDFSIVSDPSIPNRYFQTEIDNRFEKIMDNIRAFVWSMSGSYQGLLRLNGETLSNAINLVASAIAELHKDYKTWTSENHIVVEARKELERLIELLHEAANTFPDDLLTLKVMVKFGNLPY